MKVKSEQQVANEIIKKIEEFSGKKMNKDEKDEWHDYLIHEQFAEVTQNCLNEVIRMSSEIEFVKPKK